MATCVYQDAMTIGVHQCGKTPFTQTRNITHKHGGKHSDFERMDLFRRAGNTLGRSLGLREV
jgi:hypothetical protein